MVPLRRHAPSLRFDVPQWQSGCAADARVFLLHRQVDLRDKLTVGR